MQILTSIPEVHLPVDLWVQILCIKNRFLKKRIHYYIHFAQANDTPVLGQYDCIVETDDENEKSTFFVMML